jgi:hypothetical protein
MSLIRTLSEQHWDVVKSLMEENDTELEWAGTFCGPPRWDYYLVREGDKFQRITKMNGNIVYVHTIVQQNEDKSERK